MASYYVDSGVTSTGIILYNSAYMFVYFGGTANNTTISGGNLKVSSGGTANHTTVNNDGYGHGWLTISSGGIAYNTTVNDGMLYVSFGGTATSAMVNSGALEVYSGGTAMNIIATSKTYLHFEIAQNTFIAGTYANSAFEIKNGIASYFTINGYADFTVYSGGTANNTIINDAHGWLIVSSGGIANNTTVNDGKLYVSFGGTATSAMVNSSGSMMLSSGGTADSTAVNSGGTMQVGSGGTANNTIVNSGGSMQVGSGGTANNTIVNSGGILLLSSWSNKTGVATNTFINSGGNLYVSGGTATIAFNPWQGQVVISSNITYLERDKNVYFGGSLGFLSKADIMESQIIMSGYSAIVYSGGIMRDTKVYAAGTVHILSGGSLTGKMNFLGGAIVSVEKGAIMNFDLTHTSPGANKALLNDWELIQGVTDCTITVSASLQSGIYKLADNADDFDETISVVNTSGESFGMLEVGETVTVGSKEYTLNLNDDVLSVTVSGENPPPVPSGNVAKGDRDGNGVSDVMFVWTGYNYAHGYWMNGQADWWSANAPWVSSDWDNLGSYDMSGDGKADAVMFGNVEVNGNKGAYIGYYQDGDDANGWVNIGYLDNAQNITWKNKVGNLTGNENMNSIVWYAPNLYALGVWKDGREDWATLSGNFGGDAWTLVGCGDFNGTGKDSVLMSYNSGQLFYSVGLDGVEKFHGSADWSNGWEVRAIGDFAGDGKDDIVLFHSSLGAMAMLVDGNADNYTSIGQLNAADWVVVGAGDYNGDQKDDLLVRQKSTGMLGYYSSGDTSQWVTLGYGVDMSWTVIA